MFKTVIFFTKYKFLISSHYPEALSCSSGPPPPSGRSETSDPWTHTSYNKKEKAANMLKLFMFHDDIRDNGGHCLIVKHVNNMK